MNLRLKKDDISEFSKKQFLLLLLLASMSFIACKKQCQYENSSEIFSSNYTEKDSTIAFFNQNTLKFVVENFYSVGIGDRCGHGGCMTSVLKVQNLTNNNIEVNFYESLTAMQNNSVTLLTIKCAPLAFSIGIDVKKCACPLSFSKVKYN